MKKIFWILALLILLILTSCSVPLKEGATDYAWVLVDTIDYGASDEEIEKAMQNAPKYCYVDVLEGSASQGNFSIRPYVRETGALSSQASFSTPPNTFRAGETVTLSVSLFFTETSWGGWTQIHAIFDCLPYWPKFGSAVIEMFKNKNEESFFNILYDIDKSQKDVLSLNETISATAPSGEQKGDKIAIHMIFNTRYLNLGTKYIYEWKAQ